MANKKPIQKNITREKVPQKTAAPNTTKNINKTTEKSQTSAFPEKVPFWARMKIGGKHPALVIDREKVLNKNNKEIEAGFVYRESTHEYKKDREEIKPNPDKEDDKPMFLKRPAKKPERLFERMNKNLSMPEHLKERYEKNNK